MSDDRYQLLPAHTVPIKQVCDFMTAFWPRKMALSWPEFYQWQFYNHPTAHKMDHSLVVRDKDTGELFGYIGVAPKNFYWKDGTVCKAAELTSWFYRDEIRGTRLSWDLIATLQDNYDVVTAMNLSQMALPIYYRTGFRFLRVIERMVKVFNPKPFHHVAQISPVGRHLLSVVDESPVHHYKFMEISIETLASHIGNRKLSFHHHERSAEHLIWRYQQHPFFKHIVLQLETQNVETYLVLRIETHDNYTLAHVLEIFPMGLQIGPIAECLEAFGKQNQIDLMDFNCTSSHLTAPLWKAGWLSVSQNDDCQYPHLFNPLEFRKPPTINMVFWAKNRMTDFCNLADLYITKGDNDADRPTALFIESQLAIQQ